MQAYRGLRDNTISGIHNGLRRADPATEIGIYETGFRDIDFETYYSKNSVLKQVFYLLGRCTSAINSSKFTNLPWMPL